MAGGLMFLSLSSHRIQDFSDDAKPPLDPEKSENHPDL